MKHTVLREKLFKKKGVKTPWSIEIHGVTSRKTNVAVQGTALLLRKILLVAASNFDPKTGFVVFLIPPQLMLQGSGHAEPPPLPLTPSAIHYALIDRLATGRCVLRYQQRH